MMLGQPASFEDNPDRSCGNPHPAPDFGPVVTVIAHLFSLFNIPAWALVVTLVLCANSASLECAQNGALRDPKMISDSLSAPALLPEFCPLVAWPFSCAHEVVSLVSPWAHNLKIFDVVVQSISVLVVNVLVTKERSTKVLLHDVAVFKNLFALAVDHHSDQSIFGESFEEPNVAALVWSSHDALNDEFKTAS